MFALAILIGIYSYLIFALGVLSVLEPELIFIITVVYFIFSIIYIRNTSGFPHINKKLIKENKIITGLIISLCIINLMGALGPELSFDALWYHLTIPKIFIEMGQIEYIPGGLFYYSVMPKLIDILYIPSLIFGNEIFSKLVHYSFGILSLIALFKLSREFFDEKKSLIVVLVFSSSLVFAWESITSYIDLGRTFFEIMALWGLILWHKNKDKKLLIESGVMLGLAISSKILALGSFLIFIPLIFYLSKNIKNKFKNSFIFVCAAIFISLPWYIFSFLETGNLLFPIFSKYYETGIGLSSFIPFTLFKDLFNLFLGLSDPISPIYIISIPLIIFSYKKFDLNNKIILFYCLISMIVWLLIPKTGGGRFILPYLPAFSILVVTIYSLINMKYRILFLYLIIFISIITIIFRGYANARYLPVIFGFESKSEFLTNNLNYNFGDFYDTDGWFRKNIKNSDRVLIYGSHNLYYVDFPFIHESYVKKGEWFNYILVQNQELDKRYRDWNLIYENYKANVKVYKLGDMGWHY